MTVQVTGNPTPEELAAALLVLTSRGGGSEPARPPVLSRWADKPAQLRRPLPHGPGAWRHTR